MDFEPRGSLQTFGNNMMSPKVCLIDDDDYYVESPSRKMQTVPLFPRIFTPPPASNVIDPPIVKQPPAPRACHGMWILMNVPLLPKLHHPLEQTHVTILNTKSCTIGERVVSVLKRRSIHADLYPSKAACISPENVEFCIFFYRNDKNNGIVVEVQRRFGKSNNFFQDVSAILDGARGKKTPITSKHAPLLVANDDDGYRVTSLDFISKMLSISGAETIGLQTLMSLTDPSKMGSITANQAARLFFAEEVHVADKVIHHLEDDRFKVMALVILSNVLPGLNGDAAFHRRRAPLIAVLTRYIQTDTPHVAHLACKCLEPLLGEVCDPHLWNSLCKAAEIGDTKHRPLAQQARRCLQRWVEN